MFIVRNTETSRRGTQRCPPSCTLFKKTATERHTEISTYTQSLYSSTETPMYRFPSPLNARKPFSACEDTAEALYSTKETYKGNRAAQPMCKRKSFVWQKMYCRQNRKRTKKAQHKCHYSTFKGEELKELGALGRRKTHSLAELGTNFTALQSCELCKC